MDRVRYCTPEWLEECTRRYPLNPRFEQEFQKLSVIIAFRVSGEPGWGIEQDILFAGAVDKGQLVWIKFLSENEAREGTDFILAATPHEWKSVLRKDNKFLTDFMLGKIKLEQGSKVGVLSIAPHANTFVDVLTPTELVFPDEMNPADLESYRDHVKEFRAQLGV